MSPLRIDPERPRSDLEAPAAFVRTSGGVDRPAFSAADPRARARAWPAERCRAAGFPGREDGIGNLSVRRDTGDDGHTPVGAGSRLCSAPDGGRFDGAAEAVGALEVLRWPREERVPLIRLVEAVAGADEEGSRRGLLDPAAAVDDGLTSPWRSAHREPEPGLDLPRAQEKVLAAYDRLSVAVPGARGRGSAPHLAVGRGTAPNNHSAYAASDAVLPDGAALYAELAARRPAAAT